MQSHLKSTSFTILLKLSINQINTFDSCFDIIYSLYRNLYFWSHKTQVFPCNTESKTKDLPLKWVFDTFVLGLTHLQMGLLPECCTNPFFGICSNAIIPWTESGPFQISWIEILTTIHYSSRIPWEITRYSFPKFRNTRCHNNKKKQIFFIWNAPRISFKYTDVRINGKIC